MNKEKFSVQLFSELKLLLTARKKLTVKSEINGIIADTAEKLVNTIGAEFADESKKNSTSSEPSKKSEMPCNCAQSPKTLQDIIDEAKAELTDNKTFAAIVFRVD